MALSVAPSRRVLFVCCVCFFGVGGEALLTPKVAMALLAPTKRRGLMEPPLPPPPKVPRLISASEKTFSWSTRMTSPRDGRLPFTSEIVASRSKRRSSNFKSRPADQLAVSVSGAASCHMSISPDLRSAPFSAFHEDPGLAVPRECGVSLMKLLDKEYNNCLDFATMLKFMELFGWGVDDGEKKHELWVNDWHDILKFLGGLRATTPSLRCDEFIQFLMKPGGPPLIAAYSVQELFQHVASSYLGKPLLMLPPRVSWTARETRIAQDFISEGGRQSLAQTLAGMVKIYPESRNCLDPESPFFLAWYYECFGRFLNEWYGTKHQREGSLVWREAAVAPERPVVAVEWSGRREMAYEKLPVWWIVYKGERYLFVNIWDWSSDLVSQLRYLVEQPNCMGSCTDFDVNVHFTDGADVPGMPLCLSMVAFRGLKSKVQASNKQKRKQGIWAAMYLHYLLGRPLQQRRMTPINAFDAKVMDLLDIMLANPVEVELETNACLLPE